MKNIFLRFFFPVKSVLKVECNYSVHVRTVQLKSKSYLQLKTGWNTIYIWDCTGRVMEPSPVWNCLMVLAWRSSGGMLFQVMMVWGKKEKRSTSARVYIVLNAAMPLHVVLLSDGMSRCSARISTKLCMILYISSCLCTPLFKGFPF